ncbi:MAG TPA: Holliday junction resolvase RuvX [Anaerolineaceae bacterium]|nr:Holliday junction resolvase RuvX [Anaerolineaceae bacterium]HOH91793.1 Holliday junction resolvase RuvX [Anaerolineaceae bacterium]
MTDIKATGRKFLGVDHGDKRIGLALSDDTLRFARPLRIIEHVSREDDAKRVIDIAHIEACTDILVGVPYDSDGNVGPRARKVLRFVEMLKSLTTLQVDVWDESGSTMAFKNLSLQMGQSAKQRRKPSDDRVAALILQDYLDNHYLAKDKND